MWTLSFGWLDGAPLSLLRSRERHDNSSMDFGQACWLQHRAACLVSFEFYMFALSHPFDRHILASINYVTLPVAVI